MSPSKILKGPRTEQSKTPFDPDRFFDVWNSEKALQQLSSNDFRKFIIDAFDLDSQDDYIYRATAQVTLLQAQSHINAGAQNGLHAWYPDVDNGEVRPAPTAVDIAAYTDIFRPTTNTAKALTALASNAKRKSVRSAVAEHLLAQFQPPEPTSKLVVNKSKSHVNPYLDVWAWSNQNLEWCGPEQKTVDIKISHAILPILYHHFGCVCPSYEALSLVQQIAEGRTILDIGSGNGYWTYMLRRFESNLKKKITVTAIDNAQSEWRTLWIDDTIEADGEKWLAQHSGGKNEVLLLVYPVVGNEFTSKMLKAYRGRTIIAAGAQNASGFTAFAKETIADWMSREMPSWYEVLQVPLPSFAGKDEALFVFEPMFEHAK